MTFLLAAVACLGHLVLLVGTHNWVYGLHLPKGLSKLNHLAHLLLFLALPVGLVAGWGLTLDHLFAWPPTCAVHATVLAYLGVCILVAVIWLPLLTLIRSRRTDPSIVTNREVVDLEA